MRTPSGGSSLFRPLPSLVLAATAIVLALLVIWGTHPKDESQVGDIPSEQIQKKAEPLSSAEDSVPMPAQGHSQPTQPAPEVSWEESLDAILSGAEDNRSTVRRLLEGFDRLPPEAQTEYIAHALNLCEDDNYGEMEAIYLRSDTTAEVREQIFDDSLNRPDEIKLPMMARTMSALNHPLTEEAKEILVLYLDLEPDAVGPIDWNARVQAYLKENSIQE